MHVLCILDGNESRLGCRPCHYDSPGFPFSDINRCPRHLSRDALTLISILKTLNREAALKMKVFVGIISH